MAATTEGSNAEAKASAGSARTTNPGEEQQRELEVQLADMETRLRQTILRIIRPVLDQAADVSLRIDELNIKVDSYDQVMLTAQLLQEEVTQQKEFNIVITDQLSTHDQQARTFEKSTVGSLAELRAGKDTIDQKLEDHHAEMRKQSRELVRMWDEAGLAQAQHDDANKLVWEGMATNSRVEEKARDEIMDLVRELQREREELMEELFGEGKGLTELNRELTLLTKFCAPLPAVEKKLKETVEHFTILQGKQQENSAFCIKNKDELTAFVDETREEIVAMKAEFKDDSNRLIAHNACIMKDIRQDYMQEIEAAKKIRSEIDNIQEFTRKFCDEVSEGQQTESRRIDALQKSVVTDIEEMQKKRKKERTTTEAELKSLREEFELTNESSQQVRINVEYLSRILGLVLESERVASAVHVQDFTDRGAERWLTLPADAEGRHAPPSQSAGALLDERKRMQQSGKESFHKATSEVVSIDWRKGLAKCEYLPGGVSFGGTVYERRDILLLHHRLLQKAHDAFMKGPGNDEVGLVSLSITRQPGANGGAAAGEDLTHSSPLAKSNERRSLAKKVDEESEDLKLAATSSFHNSSRSSRQRAGSQGQPQAMGSRGTMSGPLSETVPSPEVVSASARGPAPLKLPAIDGMLSNSILSNAASGISRNYRKSLTAR